MDHLATDQPWEEMPILPQVNKSIVTFGEAKRKGAKK